MEIGNIRAGYMGYANIDGETLRFSDASIAARQDVMVPDLVAGSYNRMAFGYGPVSVDGSISGPMTENFIGTGTDKIWNWAAGRTNCGGLTNKQIDLYYFCEGTPAPGSNSQRRFKNMYVNSMTFSVAAGDIANFSLDVIGAGPAEDIEWDASTYPGHVEDADGDAGPSEKLVTWDTVSLALAGTYNTPATEIKYSNFELTISNNVEAVYALSDNSDYFPFDLVPGIRAVTGSFSAYNIPEGIDGADNYGDAANDADQRTTITLNIAGSVYTVYAKLHRVEPTSGTGPVVSTIGFTGVGPQDLSL